MAKSKIKRTFVHVVWDEATSLWLAEIDGKAFDFRCRREVLVEAVVPVLRGLMIYAKRNSELVIHTKRGTIARGASGRRTYGNDPRRSKG